MQVFKNPATNQWAVVPGEVDGSSLQTILNNKASFQPQAKVTAERAEIDTNKWLYVFKPATPGEVPSVSTVATTLSPPVMRSLEEVVHVRAPETVEEESLPGNQVTFSKTAQLVICSAEDVSRFPEIPTVEWAKESPWIFAAWTDTISGSVWRLFWWNADQLQAQDILREQGSQLVPYIGKRGRMEASIQFTRTEDCEYPLVVSKLSVFAETWDDRTRGSGDPIPQHLRYLKNQACRSFRSCVPRHPDDPLIADIAEQAGRALWEKGKTLAKRAKVQLHVMKETVKDLAKKIDEKITQSGRDVSLDQSSSQCEIGPNTLKQLRLGLVIPAEQTCDNCQSTMRLQKINFALRRGTEGLA